MIHLLQWIAACPTEKEFEMNQTPKLTRTMLSKAASDLAAQAPLLDRVPLRQLALAIKWAGYRPAYRAVYPTGTPTHCTKLAVALVKRAMGSMAGSCGSMGMAGSSPAPSAPRVTTPSSFSGKPAEAMGFAKKAGMGETFNNLVASLKAKGQQMGQNPLGTGLGAAGGALAGYGAGDLISPTGDDDESTRIRKQRKAMLTGLGGLGGAAGGSSISAQLGQLG